MDIKFTDCMIAAATLLGPVLAVQAQKWIERGRALKDRQRSLFLTLMATRATTLSPAHVEALNSVPVEFYAPNNVVLKAIRDDWHSYMDHLNATGEQAVTELWQKTRADLMVALLFGMARYLKYDLSKSQIARDVYLPQAHTNAELEQLIIRQSLVKALTGGGIPMAVKEFPGDPNFIANQVTLQTLLKEWLSGERVVKVEQADNKAD